MTTEQLLQEMTDLGLTGDPHNDSTTLAALIQAHINCHYKGAVSHLSLLAHDLNTKLTRAITLRKLRERALECLECIDDNKYCSIEQLDVLIEASGLPRIRGKTFNFNCFIVYAATDGTTPAMYEILLEHPLLVRCCLDTAKGIILGELKNGSKTATHISFEGPNNTVMIHYND